jgi:acyl-ACP thioesterase
MDASQIINYFQDCSTFQSEDLNLGMSYLKQKNRVWLLASWQLHILKPIKFGEEITIATWPYAFKDFYGYRNFIMKDKHGQVLSVADSIWIYIDTLKQCPTRVPDDNAGYKLEPPYEMEHLDRKIPIPDDLTSYPPFQVKKSNIDSYNHVNNGQYIKMAEEFLPDDFIYTKMRVEYKKQALLDDIILPRVNTEDNKYCIVLDSVEGKPFSIVEFA